MKKRILLIIGSLYIIFAIIITIFLFNKNEYGIYETKNSYFICNEAITEYSNSTLVKFDKNNKIESFIDRKIYYLDNNKEVKKEKVESYDKKQDIFMINDVPYESKYFLGQPSRGYILVGTLIKFLNNKIPYLIFIIIPVVLLLIFEIYLLIRYMKKKKDNKDEKDTK